MQNYSIHWKQTTLSDSGHNIQRDQNPRKLKLTQYNRDSKLNMFELIKTQEEKKEKKNT